MQVLIPECEFVLERLGHSAMAISMNPNLIEITIFGGCRHFSFMRSDRSQLMLRGTTVLKFGRLYLLDYYCVFYNEHFSELRPDKQWILLPVVGSINDLNYEVTIYLKNK